MKEKYIKLIDNQIDKLSKEDFDLDAWKGSTKYVLTLVFGPKDPKVAEIDNLKIDYSSWALRDSKSDYKPMETCKKKGREILEIAKDELELFGVEADSAEDKVRGLLGDQADGVLKEETPHSDKKAILKKLNKDQLVELVLEFLKADK